MLRKYKVTFRDMHNHILAIENVECMTVAVAVTKAIENLSCDDRDFFDNTIPSDARNLLVELVS